MGGKPASGMRAGERKADRPVSGGRVRSRQAGMRAAGIAVGGMRTDAQQAGKWRVSGWRAGD